MIGSRCCYAAINGLPRQEAFRGSSQKSWIDRHVFADSRRAIQVHYALALALATERFVTVQVYCSSAEADVSNSPAHAAGSL